MGGKIVICRGFLLILFILVLHQDGVALYLPFSCVLIQAVVDVKLFPEGSARFALLDYLLAHFAGVQFRLQSELSEAVELPL